MILKMTRLCLAVRDYGVAGEPDCNDEERSPRITQIEAKKFRKRKILPAVPQRFSEALALIRVIRGLNRERFNRVTH
jgi:hypothetical protein